MKMVNIFLRIYCKEIGEVLEMWVKGKVWEGFYKAFMSVRFWYRCGIILGRYVIREIYLIYVFFIFGNSKLIVKIVK